jgi:hypothetical protein
MSPSRTFFAEAAGRGYAFAVLFAAIFYSLCFLHAKWHVAVDKESPALAVYWLASVLYFGQILLANFAKLYGAFLRRLRLYSATRVFFQWFVGVPLLTLPFLIAMLLNYQVDVQHAVETWSIKLPLTIYGLSLVIIVYLFTIGCKLVAQRRGTKSTR